MLIYRWLKFLLCSLRGNNASAISTVNVHISLVSTEDTGMKITEGLSNRRNACIFLA